MFAEVAPAVDPSRLLGLQPALGPDQLLQLVSGLLGGLVTRAATVFNAVTEYYVLWTGNFNSHTGPGNLCFHSFSPRRLEPAGCRFTDNSSLRTLYALTSAMAMTMLAGILTYAFMRSMFEHSFRARYTLKAMLPRMLVVIVLVTFGLALMQQAVDLNNAAVDTIWTHQSLPGVNSNLWELMLGGPAENVILAVLLFLVAVMLVLLVITSVARNLLLVILVAGAPLAFVCMLLPELDSYAASWHRLFFTTVFTQVVQVLILRVSLMLLFEDHGVLSAVHGIVALYLVLRVPSALHAASHAESKAMLYAKHAGHGAVKAFEHAVEPEHHTRSHSAAH
ncbi:MAG: conjugal transfer protein TrbL family protein [Candidatus Dormibacteria bacterium]